MKSRSPRRQRGAEIVEFLITLPAMVLVWFLLVEMGVALIDQSVLANASRVGAREAIRGASKADAEAAASRMYPSMISWRPEGAPAATPEFDWSCEEPDGCSIPPGTPVTVTITYTYPFFLTAAFGPLLPDMELRGSSTMHMISN